MAGKYSYLCTAYCHAPGHVGKMDLGTTNDPTGQPFRAFVESNGHYFTNFKVKPNPLSTGGFSWGPYEFRF